MNTGETLGADARSYAYARLTKSDWIGVYGFLVNAYPTVDKVTFFRVFERTCATIETKLYQDLR